MFQGTEQKRVADKRSKKVSKRFEKTLNEVKKKEVEIERRLSKHNNVLDSNICIKEKIYELPRQVRDNPNAFWVYC